MARGALYRLLRDAYKGHVTFAAKLIIMLIILWQFLAEISLNVTLQPKTKSFLLFRMDMSGLQIMKYFSHKHRLHSLLTFEYDFACFTLRHLMVYVTFLSLMKWYMK